jgi:hypothetical protein
LKTSAGGAKQVDNYKYNMNVINFNFLAARKFASGWLTHSRSIKFSGDGG